VRQNLVASTQEIENLKSAPTLHLLDLRDNQLEAVPNLSAFTSLTTLDFSYNQIRSLAPLGQLYSDNNNNNNDDDAPALVELFAACNKITSVDGLSKLARLTMLELGSNRIKTTDGLEVMVNLNQLWLGQNRISEIGAALSHLTNLKKLSLQSNRLASMKGLGGCTALEELYLSHNGLKEIEDVDSLVNIKILDVANNNIRSLCSLEKCMPLLTDVWANDNGIESLEEVERCLKPHAERLSCVYLYGCPCAVEQHYKLRMKHLLPKLEQLDDMPI
jgi:protein phosphatase 1 regulatory subunit 7